MMKQHPFKSRIRQLIVNEVNPPPLLFFTLFTISYFFPIASDTTSYTLFFSGLVFLLLFNYNHFYFYSPLLNGSIGYLAIVNMLVGVIASNQKWKLYLYLFVIGGSLTIQYKDTSIVYQGCSAFFIAYQAHTNMVFKSVSDNRVFFIGFMTIGVYSTLKLILSSVTVTNSSLLLVIPISIKCCFELFENMVWNLKEFHISKIRSSEKAVHYIEILSTNFDNNAQKAILIETHRQGCHSTLCFCRLKKDEQITKSQFITSLCQTFLEILTNQEKQKFTNYYISRLLNEGCCSKASLMMQRTYKKTYNLFRIVERSRNFSLLKETIDNEQKMKSSCALNTEILTNDKYYIKLGQLIKDIVSQKILFWKEIGKKQSEAAFLQSKTLQIMQKMKNLNEFYFQQIKAIQSKVKFFNASILYAIYLLATTNFKQLAEQILKSVRHQTLRMRQVIQNNQSEVYGVKVRVKQQHNNYKKQHIQLIIEQVSNSFCRLSNFHREQLVEKDIEMIIPELYRNKHNESLQRLFVKNKNYQANFIARERIAPLLIANNEVININIIVKFYLSQTNELQFMANIRIAEDSRPIYVSNFNQMLVNTKNQQHELYWMLKDQKMIQEIEFLKQEWKTTKKISLKRINLSLNNQDMIIEVSSPFQQSYKNSEIPPIHIHLLTYGKNSILKQRKDIQYKQVDVQLNKLQNNFHDTDSQISTKSTSQTSSFSALLNFSESKIQSFFIYFIAIFLITITFSFLFVSLTVFISGVPWKTSDLESNPLYYVISINKIEQTIAAVINQNEDRKVLRVIVGPSIQSVFTVQFKKNQENLKKYLLEIERAPYLLQTLHYRYMNQPIEVKNIASQPNTTIKIKANIILRNYINDVFLLAEGKPFQGNFIEGSYYNDMHLLMDNFSQQSQKIITDSVASASVKNAILIVIACLTFLLLIAPLWWLNKRFNSKMKRIYELIVSIQTSLILKEITNLKNILSIVQSSAKQTCIELSKKVIRQSHSDFVIEDDNQSSDELAMRKREGQINSKKFNRNNKTKGYALYLILCFFCVFTTLIISERIKFISIISQSSKSMIYMESQLKDETITLMNLRRLMSTDTQLYFNNIELSEWIQAEIDANRVGFNDIPQQDLLRKCPQTTVTINLCESYNLSELMFKGMSLNYLRKSFYLSNKQQLFQYKLSVLYTQPLLILKQRMTEQRVNDMIEQLMALDLANEVYVFKIYYASIAYFIVCIMLGLYLIIGMKKQYSTQILAISFLNAEMLSKNKRIQSFISQLVTQKL